MFHHIRCFAHVLNLGAQAALHLISADLNHLRTGIRKISSSPQSLSKFEELRGMNINLRPKLDCKTKWNSTYDMLDVALKLKDSLDLYFHQSNCLLPFDSWSKFEQILDYLDAFKEATLLTCADKYPTLSLAVPLYNEMMDHLQLWMTEKTQPGDFIHNSTVAAYSKIKDYYNLTSDCYTISTVLDPRFNIGYFKKNQGEFEEEKVDEIIAIVEKVYLMYYGEIHNSKTF